MSLPQTFERLFEFLRESAYVWEPQTPDQLLKMRKEPEAYGPLVRCFGLGLPVSFEELRSEGLPEELIHQVLPLRTAISRSGNVCIAHDHWPPRREKAVEYVHLGRESWLLLQEIQSRFDALLGARVLDLGSGAGALALEIAGVAEDVLGIELSAQAVEWAKASARANHCPNARFVSARIGAPEADRAAGGGEGWDYAVFNPPMMIPYADASFTHRDGGDLGIEMPFVFLDFALRHLRPGGEAWCLATNPVVHGKSLFFDRLKEKDWEEVESKRLNSRFNQSMYRKERYEERGIERVELWFLRLRKPNS